MTSAATPASSRPERRDPASGAEAGSFAGRVARRAAEVALAPFAEVGALARMLSEAVFWGARPRYRGRVIVESMEFVGVGSIFIITVTGLFVGAVLGLQLADGFREFGAENQTGAVVGLALAREIGPVFAALMVSSRAGSAITTELGSMRVTSQIDALVTMAVNPVQYLVVPRLIACRQGFFAGGGAAGVGRATNRSVVHSAIAILMLDYLITGLVLGQGLF